jgi:hypothetical protein
MLTLELQRINERKDNALPRDKNPSTETLLLNFACARTDRALPQSTWRITERAYVLPTMHRPCTLHALLNRAKLRIEQLEPSSRKFRIDALEPNRACDRTDKELPTINCARIEVLLSMRAWIPATDIELPMRAQARMERLLPRVTNCKTLREDPNRDPLRTDMVDPNKT